MHTLLSMPNHAIDGMNNYILVECVLNNIITILICPTPVLIILAGFMLIFSHDVDLELVAFFT